MKRPIPNSAAAMAAVFIAAAGLSGCDKSVKAPTDTGVCWHAVRLKDGALKFNKLASNQPALENCAVKLEEMRLRFGGFGAAQEQVVGVYQGQWLFIQREGVLTSRSLTGGRYVALVRSGDGRLVIPGAMPRGR